tara:strand:- start:630 stop:995 length:366 start_codon:yes stop_codon:yes gene_type:complete
MNYKNRDCILDTLRKHYTPKEMEWIEKHLIMPESLLNKPKFAYKNKFASTFRRGKGKLNYKWYCLNKMKKLDVGESIKVEDRTRETIRLCWIGMANRRNMLNGLFEIIPINKNTHLIKRIK